MTNLETILLIHACIRLATAIVHLIRTIRQRDGCRISTGG